MKEWINRYAGRLGENIRGASSGEGLEKDG